MNIPTLPSNFTLVDAILNTDNIYSGDLTYYYQTLYNTARNLGHPYHGLTHINHVTWESYKAALWYLKRGQITPTEARELLIAALFHDFDHSDKTGSDDEEINRAIAALRKYILQEDRDSLTRIEGIIWATRFPHLDIPEPTLCQLIIRDTDISQVLGLTWQQLILFGLGEEMKKTWQQMLRDQEGFIRRFIVMKTEWGQLEFPATLIEEKIEHIKKLMSVVLTEK